MTRAEALAVIAVCAACVGSVPKLAQADRVLLAVGSSQGLPDEWPLAYAVSDAERFASIMQDLGDVAARNVSVLREPSVAEFVAALRKLAGSTAAGSTFLLYFSGHGSQSALHMRGQRLTAEALQREISRIPAALQLIFVDSCRGSVSRKGFSAVKPFAISVAAPHGHRGMVVVHAAGEGEAALESNRIHAGVFSYYLQGGLRGAADRDVDGRVSLAEAYEYAYTETVRASADSDSLLQHPTLEIDLQGAGPLVLTRLSPARSVLTLPADGHAHYIIFQKGSNAPYAEARTRVDAPTRLALPAGQFVVYRRDQDRHEAVEVTLPFGGEKRLLRENFSVVAAQEVTTRGGRYAQYRSIFAAAVGVVADAQGNFGTGAAISYGRGGIGFVPTVALGFASREFETDASEVKRQDLDLTPGAEYRFVLAGLNAALGLGATAALLQQRLSPLFARAPEGALRHADAARSDSAFALGLGWTARTRLSVPFAKHVAWYLEGAATMVFFRQQAPSGVEAMPRIQRETRFMISSGPMLAF